MPNAGEAPGRLAIIAMGKCGARELNYISDVDVVFAAEPADAKTARLGCGIHEHRYPLLL
ncbi:MAG: hypothetical protein U1U88_002299 [Lawsonella clevelandensis]